MKRFRISYNLLISTLVSAFISAACSSQLQPAVLPTADLTSEVTPAALTPGTLPTATTTARPTLTSSPTATSPPVIDTLVATEQATASAPTPSASASPNPGLPETTAVPASDEGSSFSPPTLLDIPWSDRSSFRRGLIAAEQSVLEELPGASVYHLDVTISEDLVRLAGTEEIFYTNQEDVSLPEIYLRLFPNLTGGSATVSHLAVNNQPAEPAYELQDSALRIPLSVALEPGEQAVISMTFEVQLPEGDGGNYGTFSFSDDMLALAHFYPMIPVYDDQGWNVEIAPGIGDVVYTDSSFYLVRVTAPATQTLVASGIAIDEDSQNGHQVVTYAAGPVRDFYLAASSRYTMTTRTVGETTVNSYGPAELVEGVDRAGDFAENALLSFNSRFGLYPFTEFDVVSTTTSALGIEYPGVIALLVDMYKQPQAPLLESVVAHEVAHQWFYSVVGSDQVDEPWVDEALAQYATLLYYDDVYGPSGAQGFRGSLQRRWDRVDRAEIPIGLPVRDYTGNEYSAIVYGRGPLFIEALAETMGPDPFSEFLRDYYQTHQWGTATGASFKLLAEQHCACDLSPIFETWVDPSPGDR